MPCPISMLTGEHGDDSPVKAWPAFIRSSYMALPYTNLEDICSECDLMTSAPIGLRLGSDTAATNSLSDICWPIITLAPIATVMQAVGLWHSIRLAWHCLLLACQRGPSRD